MYRWKNYEKYNEIVYIVETFYISNNLSIYIIIYKYFLIVKSEYSTKSERKQIKGKKR